MKNYKIVYLDENYETKELKFVSNWYCVTPNVVRDIYEVLPEKTIIISIIYKWEYERKN